MLRRIVRVPRLQPNLQVFSKRLSSTFSRSSSLSDKRTSRFYLFPALCFALGTWQVYRLQWKNNLVRVMNERLQEEPIEWTRGPWTYPFTTCLFHPRHATPMHDHPWMFCRDDQLQPLEHRRILVRGRFLHDWEMLVGPRNKGGPGRSGYYVYTPLLTEEGTLMFVNRGWIPKSHLDPETRQHLNPELAFPQGSQVAVHGMLRRPKFYQPGGSAKWFLPNPQVQTHDGKSVGEHPRWLWTDVDLMMKYVHDAIADTTLPQKVNHELTSYFVEEVLDWSQDDAMTREMMAWHQDSTDLEQAASSMPTLLASLKAVQSDPRMFHGKPILGPPSVNVSNKHLGYVYTWYALGTILSAVIYVTSRGKQKPTRVGR